MAKDLNNVVVILDGNMELARQALDEGKTVEMAVEKGEKAKQNLDKGYMDYLSANIELVSDTAPENAVCGCGKPANAIVRLWK